MLRKTIVLMVALFVISTGISYASTIELPQTGQTKCYDANGNLINCSGTGQDGEIRAGVAWPYPRFTVSGGCVTDNLTGLMWTRNGNLSNGTKDWYGALDYANNLSLCGYSDWRLPNINELESLVNADQDTDIWLNTQGFINVQSNIYWSSTTYAYGTDCAWIVVMWDGYVTYDDKDVSSGYVWPVRAGQFGNSDPLYPANIWKTGQGTSYATGDDGDLERGVAWPSPRFTVSGDCVTDNLTGLMWAKNGNLPNGTKIWSQALDYANNLSLCGYSDWRLSNRKELRSLVDYSQYDPALPSGHPFISVQSGYNWSSTTFLYGKNSAWIVNMWDGSVDFNLKRVGANYVWPVRAGQFGNIYEEDNPAIDYTGTWNNYSCTSCSGGALKYSNETGAKATFTFNGTGIKWIVAKGPILGKAKVYFDGSYLSSVDLYSSTPQWQVVLQKTGLTSGSHTVILEVSGQKNPASTNYHIDIDAFEVIP